MHKNPPQPWWEWKADDGRLYCSEYCADGGDTAFPCIDGDVATLQEHRYER